MPKKILTLNSEKKQVKIRIGTSGWNYPHWKGEFYPANLKKRQWFSFYAQVFDTVEINNTFYRLPEDSVFRSWRKQAPAGFVYSLKANRFITHMKKLKVTSQSLDIFYRRADILGPHLGPLLYQLPPGWNCNPERLRDFVNHLDHARQQVIEFRNDTWFVPEIHELLVRGGMAFCVHDFYSINCPRWVSGDLVYLRLHGPTGHYSGGYETSCLRKWGRWLRKQAEKGREVYVYFNNDEAGHAPRDARKLKSILGI